MRAGVLVQRRRCPVECAGGSPRLASWAQLFRAARVGGAVRVAGARLALSGWDESAERWWWRQARRGAGDLADAGCDGSSSRLVAAGLAAAERSRSDAQQDKAVVRACEQAAPELRFAASLAGALRGSAFARSDAARRVVLRFHGDGAQSALSKSPHVLKFCWGFIDVRVVSRLESKVGAWDDEEEPFRDQEEPFTIHTQFAWLSTRRIDRPWIVPGKRPGGI